MSNLFQLPKVRPYDSTGTSPLAGAKLNFYLTGTSTRQNTFQDIALTVPQANPVVADAGGRFTPIYLDPTLPNYRVTLTDSAGVVQSGYPMDDYPSNSVGAQEVGAAINPITDEEDAAGLVSTDLALQYDYDDIRRYKADPALTDNTAQFQNAFDSMIPGRRMKFQPGTYMTSGNVYPCGCEFQGSTRGQTIIMLKSGATYDGVPTPAIWMPDAWYNNEIDEGFTGTFFHELVFDGNRLNNANDNIGLILFGFQQRCVNVTVQNTDGRGIFAYSSTRDGTHSDHTFIEPTFIDCRTTATGDTGIEVGEDTGAVANYTDGKMIGCVWGSSEGEWGCNIRNSGGWRVFASRVNSPRQGGFLFAGGNDIKVIGCFVDDYGRTVNAVAPAGDAEAYRFASSAIGDTAGLIVFMGNTADAAVTPDAGVTAYIGLTLNAASTGYPSYKVIGNAFRGNNAAGSIGINIETAARISGVCSGNELFGFDDPAIKSASSSLMIFRDNGGKDVITGAPTRWIGEPDRVVAPVVNVQTTATIASNVIAVTAGVMQVTTGTLISMTGGVLGMRVGLQTVQGGGDVTVNDGNAALAAGKFWNYGRGDIIIRDARRDIVYFRMIFDGTRNLWVAETPGQKLNTGSPISFADGDTSPSVLSGSFFRTANTSGTVISAFDDGVAGQVIYVKVNDVNTDFDFSGTTLKGNAGSDWTTPTTNDHMTCIFDGTNWLCTISKNV